LKRECEPALLCITHRTKSTDCQQLGSVLDGQVCKHEVFVVLALADEVVYQNTLQSRHPANFREKLQLKIFVLLWLNDA